MQDETMFSGLESSAAKMEQYTALWAHTTGSLPSEGNLPEELPFHRRLGTCVWRLLAHAPHVTPASRNNGERWGEVAPSRAENLIKSERKAFWQTPLWHPAPRCPSTQAALSAVTSRLLNKPVRFWEMGVPLTACCWIKSQLWII